MKTPYIFIVLIFLLSGSLFAQKNDILISIDEYQISKSEFERIYKKNNQALTDDLETKSPKEYLEMYIDFKLKVIEAMKLKMDTATAFKKELAGYRTELAAPYLTDMKYDEALIKELYNRMKKEINASHILFRIKDGAGNEEEQAVLQKAEKVRLEILNGKDFNEAAFEYSEDPSAKSNKGNLGYFSAFQMVTPFENKAFNTPVGNVSEPVRTTFGYHLIKVHDIRLNQGEIKVAHIMKMFPREGEFDKTAIKAEIDSVYAKLLKGANFEEMVKQHSDDKRSAADKGEMPWFSSNQMIPEFAGPAFSLKNNGDFTSPVETPYGYHIIKRIGHRPVPSFDEMRANIEERIKKDPERSSSTKKVFIEKLKKEYNFSEASKNISRINPLNVDNKINENPLMFTIDEKQFLLNDFKQYLLNENVKNGTFSDYYHPWTEYEIIQMEDARLEEKHPDFKYLMQEYHDGLLFFNIMEEKIWKHAAEDSIGLEKFYAENKSRFLWEERFKGLIITCNTNGVREEAENYFDAQLSPEEVEDLLNNGQKQIEIKQGTWEKGDNPVIDYFVWNAQTTPGFDPELTFIRGNIIDPEPKSLNEAKGFYISAYQDYIEKTWIKSLRKKYKVKINRKLLKTVPHV